MPSYTRYPALILLAASLAFGASPQPHAHSHNDYEQTRPLLAALELGFASVEADVYLIDGDLHVAHDAPKELRPERTLTRLYLEPLAVHVRAHGGRVYPGYNGPFYLMIDVKTESAATYARLKALLAPYRDMIADPHRRAGEANGPVTIFISGFKGRRPFYEILSDPAAPVALDGTPDELGLGIPAAVEPVVSASYTRFLKWTGAGAVAAKEQARLREFVTTAHREGKKVRLWAIPHDERVWSYLLEQGVDLLSADDLPRLITFLSGRAK